MTISADGISLPGGHLKRGSFACSETGRKGEATDSSCKMALQFVWFALRTQHMKRTIFICNVARVCITKSQFLMMIYSIKPTRRKKNVLKLVRTIKTLRLFRRFIL
jgi:hypothetical protein